MRTKAGRRIVLSDEFKRLNNLRHDGCQTVPDSFRLEDRPRILAILDPIDACGRDILEFLIVG